MRSSYAPLSGNVRPGLTRRVMHRLYNVWLRTAARRNSLGLVPRGTPLSERSGKNPEEDRRALIDNARRAQAVASSYRRRIKAHLEAPPSFQKKGPSATKAWADVVFLSESAGESAISGDLERSGGRVHEDELLDNDEQLKVLKQEDIAEDGLHSVLLPEKKLEAQVAITDWGSGDGSLVQQVPLERLEKDLSTAGRAVQIMKGQDGENTAQVISPNPVASAGNSRRAGHKKLGFVVGGEANLSGRRQKKPTPAQLGRTKYGGKGGSGDESMNGNEEHVRTVMGDSRSSAGGLYEVTSDTAAPAGPRLSKTGEAAANLQPFFAQPVAGLSREDSDSKAPIHSGEARRRRRRPERGCDNASARDQPDAGIYTRPRPKLDHASSADKPSAHGEAMAAGAVAGERRLLPQHSSHGASSKDPFLTAEPAQAAPAQPGARTKEAGVQRRAAPRPPASYSSGRPRPSQMKEQGGKH